jgi:pantothenate kinase
VVLLPDLHVKMEAVVEGLVDDVRQLASHAGGDKGGRILIGICGIPGSGKSQLARHVVDRLNANSANRQAVVVGMDGWHLTRAQLAAMPNPDEAKARRGAPWTFDDEVSGYTAK